MKRSNAPERSTRSRLQTKRSNASTQLCVFIRMSRSCNESKVAINEFIASVKVAHWVELAERSAFKGHYRRAIDRYRDALFYLNQDVVKEEVQDCRDRKDRT